MQGVATAGHARIGGRWHAMPRYGCKLMYVLLLNVMYVYTYIYIYIYIYTHITIYIYNIYILYISIFRGNHLSHTTCIIHTLSSNVANNGIT